MKLYIIRHAQSTNNALTDQGSRVSDPGLTELGYRQAEIVAQHLTDGVDPEYRLGVSEEDTGVSDRHAYNITRFYCSAMYRALLTACPIGKALGLTPEVWIDIHEVGGIFEGSYYSKDKKGRPGKTRAEILAEFPDYILPDEITETGWWHKGFEDRPTCHGRAVKVATQLRQRADSDERIAIISHGGFIDSLIKALLNQLPYPHAFYYHYNTAISRIDFRTDGTLDIRHLNRFDHLPQALIS